MHTFRSFPTRTRRAFTLLEFIVVLGILFILAAILLPVFGRRHPNPGRAQCQSNLKQIGLGFAQYTQDYNEKLPIWRYGADPAKGWAANIQPYLKSTQIYQCPIEANNPNPDPASSGYCDYFYNSNLGPQKGGRKLEYLVSPAYTILLGDAASFSSDNTSNGGTLTASGIDGRMKGEAVAQGQWASALSGSRHFDGGNYCFVDGHVKWYRPEGITRDPATSRQSKPTFRWSAKNPPVSGS